MSETDAENHEPASLDAAVDFVLNHSDMSPWLKNALATGVDRDPVAVLNDLEILNFVFRARVGRSSSGRQS